MDSDYIGQTRLKLQKRLKRLTTSGFQSFHWVLLQTWGFLQENEVTKGILDDLERRFPKAQERADEVLGGRIKVGSTESDHVALCCALLKKCSTSPNFDYLNKLGGALTGGSHGGLGGAQEETRIAAFCKTYVEGLFDYIDEQIGDKRMTLFLLKKFKHRCEWFRRSELLAKSKANTRVGERTLALDLYEYLHDQGVQFHIEPHSASGRIDLISSQIGNDRLVADVKIFNPAGGQDLAYIAKGFRQIYDYTKDFNEPIGFLIIFKTCVEDLSITTSNQQSAVPFIACNHKTIFFVIIDVCEYKQSASNRGKLKLHEITQEKLIALIVAPEP